MPNDDVSILKIAQQADEFFMNRSPIHDTMKRLVVSLGELNIPFAIAGAMAANAHGHRRTTADVDILIREGDLQRFKEERFGLGWVEKFEGSKNFRDATNSVSVDTLIVGQYPGDGRPKPVAFPEPETVAEIDDEGIPYVSLKTLLELKIASGMTAQHRLQDMADVIQLIRANKLPQEYSSELNPYVAEKYVELWKSAQVDEDY